MFLFVDRIQVCDDLCGIVRVYHSSQALHDQRSPDLSQTESSRGSFGESVACFAQADAGIVRDEVLHATGMVSSVFVDYVIVGLNDSRICADFFWGCRIKSMSEDPAAHRALGTLTKSKFLAPPWGKQ